MRVYECILYIRTALSKEKIHFVHILLLYLSYLMSSDLNKHFTYDEKIFTYCRSLNRHVDHLNHRVKIIINIHNTIGDR